MRIERERKKKLILAFHFQLGNRAGWDCETCRKDGLVAKRRCGFIPSAHCVAGRTVWGRKGALTEECPKSAITAESLSFVEEFFVRKRLGMNYSMEMEARAGDAFLILENEMEREQRDATTQY